MNERSRTANVDPSVDLVTTMYDNPTGQYNELAGVGLEDKVGFGIFQRDPQEAEKVLRSFIGIALTWVLESLITCF